MEDVERREVVVHQEEDVVVADQVEQRQLLLNHIVMKEFSLLVERKTH